MLIVCLLELSRGRDEDGNGDSGSRTDLQQSYQTRKGLELTLSPCREWDQGAYALKPRYDGRAGRGLGAVYRDDVKPPMLDAGLRCNLVRHLTDLRHRSAQHCRFQTVGSIQMQVKCRSGYLVIVVLSLHKSGRERALAVPVNVNDAADTFPISLLFDLLGGQEPPDSIAHPFGSVGVAFGFDVLIEIHKQIVINRNRYPLHLEPVFFAQSHKRWRMMILKIIIRAYDLHDCTGELQ